MSWKLDDIDFEDFGVYVNRSSGVLDLPKLINDSINWLDENGREYWQAIENIKYSDREIVLSCFIYNLDGYESFKTKVADFYAALSGPGKRMLETPFGNTIEVSLQVPVQLTRKTSYVASQQYGLFTLRLTVQGDSEFDFITIYDKSSSAVKEIVKTKNLTISKTLQGEEYATMTVESNTPLLSGMYEYIKINTDGVGFDYFLLPSAPTVRKDSSNKFVYDLRFDGITLHFKQMKFILNGQAEFDFYGDLQDIADLVCENVNRFIWFLDRFSVASCAATVKKLHNFSGEDCLSVLQRICTEYGMEYRFQRQPDTTYQIHISEFAGKTNSVSLEYGKGNSLYQITRGAMDTSKLCTVLWAFGAAKNLQAGYRSGLKRLSFTANPLKANETLYGTWEHTVNFDEIFPNRTAAVTGYLQVLPEDLTSAEKEVYPNGIFVVGDSTLDFDINDYLSGGLTAKIVMKTGDLAGYQFDILRYDHSLKHIHIIRFKDEVGGLFPNETLQIAPGDTYTLVDMNQPASYVTTAESALQAAAQEYIDKWSVPAHEYQVRTNPAFVQANPGTGFDVGDIMTILDTDLGVNVENRVTSLTYNHNSKVFDLTLSTYKKLPKRLETDFRLQVIERAMFATKKETGEVIRDEQQPTGEVVRKLLDPDNKLRVDNLINNGSLDARMLGLDAITSQVVLTDAWFEANIGGNVEAAKQWSGFITIKNFEGINRFEVQKLKDNEEEYDPSRTWEIAETNFTALDAAKSYNIYARLNLSPASTACEIFLDEKHLDPKIEIEDGKLIVPLGNLTKDIPEEV
jgi:hypothetical protein